MSTAAYIWVAFATVGRALWLLPDWVLKILSVFDAIESRRSRRG